MRTIASLVLMFGVAAIPLKAAADQAQPTTAQAKRGQELFLKSPKGTACGTCHSLAGVGTAVGPDLKNIASYAMPRGIAMAIKMSSTETVQAVTLAAEGKRFPVRIVEKQDGQYKLWNLTNIPPELMTVAEKDVKSIERDTAWKHPPAAADYTTNELADIIAYLKWAATGSEKTVTPDEVGTSQ